MPRRARLVLPNQPLHGTQRGVNRAAIFLDDQDRHHYPRLLRAACSLHRVAIHAFVLMDNHVHLLLTPPTVSSLAQAMRLSGQSYVQAFNARHRRSGTLVARPLQLVHTHLGTACDPLISLHPLYLALGSTLDARATASREWLDLGVSHEELADIRRYIGQQRALGDPRFQAMVEKTLNRTAMYRPGGRPKAMDT